MDRRERRKRALAYLRRMLTCILAGFSSGLPLYVVAQLVQGWMRTEGVGLKEIGLTAILSLPYNFKFMWAPLMDRYVPPILGRRRGWALLTQIVLLFSLAGFGFFRPADDLYMIAGLIFIVCTFSASQDVALDAYRREMLSELELGLGTSLFVNSYRIAQFIPALGLVLSDHLPWSMVFVSVAGFMVVGIIASFLGPEPTVEVKPPAAFAEAVIGPFREFFTRSDWRQGVLILVFLFMYKLGDNMAVSLATPFYIDIGFTRSEIGYVVKTASLAGMIIGSLIGGAVLHGIGINRSLWCFGAVQMASILGFAYLSEVGNDLTALVQVISFEYVGVGLGSVAILAYAARASDRRFTATQFALFSAVMTLPRTLCTASSGFFAEALGWTNFYYFSFVLAVPGMLLLHFVAPWSAPIVEEQSAPEEVEH